MDQTERNRNAALCALASLRMKMVFESSGLIYNTRCSFSESDEHTDAEYGCSKRLPFFET